MAESAGDGSCGCVLVETGPYGCSSQQILGVLVGMMCVSGASSGPIKGVIAFAVLGALDEVMQVLTRQPSRNVAPLGKADKSA